MILFWFVDFYFCLLRCFRQNLRHFWLASMSNGKIIIIMLWACSWNTTQIDKSLMEKIWITISWHWVQRTLTWSDHLFQDEVQSSQKKQIFKDKAQSSPHKSWPKMKLKVEWTQKPYKFFFFGFGLEVKPSII